MNKLATQWLDNAKAVMDRIQETQTANIRRAAEAMADSIAAGRWVHTFGCGHATIPVEEMYPRIGGFVGFHPMVELPLTFFTRIVGEMGVHQFLFLERAEGLRRRDHEGLRIRSARHDVDFLPLGHQQREHRRRPGSQEARHEGDRLRLGRGRQGQSRRATRAARRSSTSPTSWSILAPRPRTPRCR